MKITIKHLIWIATIALLFISMTATTQSPPMAIEKPLSLKTNQKIGTSALQPKQPIADIAISNMWLDKSCCLRATFTNTGNTTVDKEFKGQVWVDGAHFMYIIWKMNLAPGNSYNWQGGNPFKLIGKHKVKMTIDSDNKLLEKDEGNNTMEKELLCTIGQLKPLKPDLIVEKIVAPYTGQPGGGLSNIEVTVKNIGIAAAVGGFRIDIVLSTDTVAPVSPGIVSPTFVEDTLLGAGGSVITITSDLGPGAAKTATISLSAGAIPADTKPGTYYLCATADVKNAISESNENNNTRCSRIIIK